MKLIKQHKSVFLKFLIFFVGIIVSVNLFYTPIVSAKTTKKTKKRIKDSKKIHPRNKKLIKEGRMKHWKFFPNVPRLTPEVAKGLYMSNKAVFVLNSYHDQDLVVGGYWGKKLKPGFDINKLVKKGQILIFYCP